MLNWEPLQEYHGLKEKANGETAKMTTKLTKLTRQHEVSIGHRAKLNEELAELEGQNKRALADELKTSTSTGQAG